MKLATLRDGSRDGQLVVVSRDLAQAHYATGIASRLQQVLDDWGFMSPQLQDLYDALNGARARHAFAFDITQCMAPLPRAYHWACCAGSSSIDLDAPLLQPDDSLHGAHPLRQPGDSLHAAQALRPHLDLQRGASDEFLGPTDAVQVASEAMGIDFGAGLAVITGDVPRGVDADRALAGVRLLLLVNDFSLRQLMPAAAAAAADAPALHVQALHGKPATAFGPVAVTPDELGAAWQDGRVHLTLQTVWNGRKVGLCEAGADINPHFGEAIAQLARTRRLRAGAIVGSGPIRAPGVEKSGRMEWPEGHGCIADKRQTEALQGGAPVTAFMKFGDSVRIEMKGPDGRSVFGAIEQEVVLATGGDAEGAFST